MGSKLERLLPCLLWKEHGSDLALRDFAELVFHLARSLKAEIYCSTSSRQTGGKEHSITSHGDGDLTEETPKLQGDEFPSSAVDGGTV